MNKKHLKCPQCHQDNNNIDADDTIVYHCYNCGYPEIDWEKENK